MSLNSKSPRPEFTAIVLAADREPDNPVARAAGVRCKSLAPVGGIPMVFRVLDALSAARTVKDSVLCGPPRVILDQAPDLKARVDSGGVRWLESRATPSLSAAHAMQSLFTKSPVLLTTSDHALLTPRVVDHFCTHAQSSGCDVVAALARHEAVTAAFPETRRTAFRLRDGAYCSCNLFAFLTPQALRAARFWRQVERHRKKPWRVANAFGWMTVVRYALGRLSLADGVDRISHRIGIKAGVVIMPYAEAAVDVDTVSDWAFVKRMAAKIQ